MCAHADGVIGIGITATAAGLLVGVIAAALARKNWIYTCLDNWSLLILLWSVNILMSTGNDPYLTTAVFNIFLFVRRVFTAHT